MLMRYKKLAHFNRKKFIKHYLQFQVLIISIP